MNLSAVHLQTLQLLIGINKNTMCNTFGGSETIMMQ
jgi:hypothetical protein